MNHITPDDQNSQKRSRRLISLRIQLLVGFTLVFTGVFAGAYYWFYRFATETALNRIKEDLVDTMKAAADGIDGDMLLDLAEEAPPRPEGYENVDDPRYWEHVEWLATVEYVEPRAYVYTYIAGPEPNTVVFIGSGSAANQQREFDGAEFLQYYEPTTRIYDGLSQLTISDSPYEDKWGSWITGYMPVENSLDEPLTAIGVDFRADYVREVQSRIRGYTFTAFGITYILLFVLVYIASDVFTQPVVHLTRAAEQIGEGDYEQDLSPLHKRRIYDEMSALALVFESMVEKVRQREETLKQQVSELRIEIDQRKRQKQVREIVETDFFQDLQAKAKTIRSRHRDQAPDE
jgi:methyl-accepting chemotaxis protein